MSMKEDRAREGKKARYRKMGFGPAMDRGEIDFGDKHPLTKKRLKNFKKKDDAPMSDERFYQQRKAQINKAGVSTKKMLTGGQAKIAAKAPPPNKIDEKDFAVLRKEKAKGRGMGLQDESVQPGKVMKARVGKSIKTGKISDMSFDEKMKRVERGQIDKKTGRFTSMNAMRDAKGFQKGETASDFNKRRMKLERAAKVAKSTRLGKILLPVVGAAVAAKTYLNSKMNKKKDVKKKMGGGMMQKPIGYKSGMGPAGAAGPSAGRPGGRRPMQKAPKGGIGSLPKKRNSDDLVVIFSTKDGTKQIKRSDLDNMSAPEKKMGGGMMKKYSKGGGADSGRIGEMKSRLGLAMNKAKRLRSMDRLTDRDIDKAKEIIKNPRGKALNMTKRTMDILKSSKKMGGGMIAPSQRPGYSKGTMVKARGCKLGRTRPTKIT